MASAVKSFVGISHHFTLNLGKPFCTRFHVQCVGSRDSSVVSYDSVVVNGVASAVENERKRDLVDFGNENRSSTIGEVKNEKDFKEEKLEALWDDGYGTQTVKDYLDHAQEMIKPDGGPPRWFTPISCGPYLRNSPVLLFLPGRILDPPMPVGGDATGSWGAYSDSQLPWCLLNFKLADAGMDGLGLGLMLHHKSLGKVFDVRCMHIPVHDRTPFVELVEWVEETVRAEHSLSPKKPIYLVGDSFGGCLALAVAARNPKIDLLVVLANPATSFGRSQLQPLFPILETLPNELHITVPYLLGFVMGNAVKMAAVNINTMLPPAKYFEQLGGSLTALLPRLSGLADIIPKATLIWKLKLLKTAAAYANSRLHAIRAEVLVIASGKDNMLPSGDEAQRLLSSIHNCKIKYFKDNGHTILLEDGINLLTIIKATCTYRQSRKHDYVMDFLPPSMSEFRRTLVENRWLRNYTGPVMLSTMEDGKIVRGLSGVPDEGPVLLVGYHMLMGLELVPLVEEFLREKKIMVRGTAHPSLFSHLIQGENKEFSFIDNIKVYGALPVSPSGLFKLFSTKSHVLLYPGGAREALHRKGEEYKLFWPDQPEFVRMAARFEATIVPFGVVGEDDIAELVLDYDDLMKIPFLSDQIRRENARYEPFKVRAGMKGEAANQALYIPGILPKVPGRLYYLFGKPIHTKGRKDVLKDKERARELYLQIKSEVETNILYLLEKRKEDPYRSILDRTLYRALYASMDQVPAFEP